MLRRWGVDARNEQYGSWVGWKRGISHVDLIEPRVQRDTFDKIVFDDLKNNATLTAMLAYLASEEPERIPLDQRALGVSARTREQMSWPECQDGTRGWEEYRR